MISARHLTINEVDDMGKQENRFLTSNTRVMVQRARLRRPTESHRWRCVENFPQFPVSRIEDAHKFDGENFEITPLLTGRSEG